MSEAETIKRNLASAGKLEKDVGILRRSQLFESARCLDGASPQKASSFFEMAFQKSPVCPEMLQLSKMLCNNKKQKITSHKDTVTVACVKNPLSLTAARKMCADAKTLRIIEESDFRSTCEAAASKRTDYCILPMCSSSDGYYPTFSKLVKAYDLKICNSKRVSKPDSDEELQFVLLSRNLEIPEKPQHVSFSFICDEQSTLPRLICALDEGGCLPVSITSSPLEYNMDRFEHRIEAFLADAGVEALLFFLEAAIPGHTVLGIY